MKFIPINQLLSILYYFKRCFIGLFFFITPLLVLAQDVTLFEQYNGRYDFTAIGNTLNPSDNPCTILTERSADLTTLTGDQDVVAAGLYWAGIGGTPLNTYPGDYRVTLNGVEINAQRTFLIMTLIYPILGLMQM